MSRQAGRRGYRRGRSPGARLGRLLAALRAQDGRPLVVQRGDVVCRACGTEIRRPGRGVTEVWRFPDGAGLLTFTHLECRGAPWAGPVGTSWEV